MERILKKGLPVFPKLLTLTAKETVNFYDRFQDFLSGYLLPLMPFNLIRLAFNFEGLFVPGLGMECYADCAAAMMEVLPRLLPPHNSEVQVAISTVGGESKNGYDLFWRVLELAVPGFDPTIPIEQPWWTRDTDILTFSREHELYFRLLAKKHVFNDARTRTNMFLRAITSSEYADVITTVQLHVDVFRHKDDDGFLPTHLRLRGIATMLHQNAKARVRDVNLPRIHHMISDDGHQDWLTEEYSSLHIQGSSPRAFQVEREISRGSRNFDRIDGRAGGNRIADGHNRDPNNRGYDRRGNDRRINRAGGQPPGPPQG